MMMFIAEALANLYLEEGRENTASCKVLTHICVIDGWDDV